MRQTWVPPEDLLHTGCLGSAGSGDHPFPDVEARMQPSDFPTPFGRGFGSPRRRAYPDAGACSSPGRACPCKRAARRRRITGSPQDRIPSRRGEDLPGSWAVLFPRAVVQHPAGPDLPSPLLLFEKIHGEIVIAFTQNRTLGIRNGIAFEATFPRPTRSRAYASPASLPRPSQGSLPARAGSPLAGRDSHPLDDESKFHGVIASPPIPIDQQSLVALNRLSAPAS